MTTYNFDKITNRKGTNCLKYDYAVERGKACGCAAAVGRRHGFYGIGWKLQRVFMRQWIMESTDTPSPRMPIIML